MKRIVFNNPNQDLFINLKSIGLLDFNSINEPRPENAGKRIFNILGQHSRNACWGNFKDIKILKTEPGKYEKLYFKKFWTSATIDLTDEGIEILKKSNIKGWSIEDNI